MRDLTGESVRRAVEQGWVIAMVSRMFPSDQGKYVEVGKFEICALNVEIIQTFVARCGITQTRLARGVRAGSGTWKYACL